MNGKIVSADDGVKTHVVVLDIGEEACEALARYTAAAIANAIHHATGQRVRDFPITIDKILKTARPS